jgi:hypothetical protein
MNREQATQRVLNRMKRKRAGRSGTKAMNVPVNNMSMADKFRLEQRRRLMNKRRDNLPGGMLTGGQAKIAAKAPPTNKIDAKDFAVLRAEKAKGRGKGLQDEKMKPGQVKKAVVGILARGAKKLLGRKRSATAKPQDVTMKGRGSGMGSMLVELFKKQKLGTPGIAGPVMRRGGIMKAKEGKSVLGEANKPPKIKLTGLGSVLGGKGGPAGRDAKSYRKYLKGLKAVGKFPGIRTAGALRQSMKDASKAGVKGFLERRAKLAGTTVKGMERAAKATRIGKIAAGVAAVGLGAKAFLNKKLKEAKENKKMGGGMMKKPMGYSKGMLFTMDDIIENMGKDYDYQTRIKYRKKSKGAPDQDSMDAYSEAEQDALKSVKKKYTGKMGGGMMMRPNPVGYKKGVLVKTKIGKNKPTKMY